MRLATHTTNMKTIACFVILLSLFPLKGRAQETRTPLVTESRVRAAWAEVEKKIDHLRYNFSECTTQLNLSKRWLMGCTAPMLKKIFDHYVENKKILSFSDPLISTLGVGKYYCAKKSINKWQVTNDPGCVAIRGFFAPRLGVIVIDDTLSEQDLSRVLLHELMHAYQYYFRLPLDLPFVGPDKALLSYYYESQANWYSMTFSPQGPWIEYLLHNTRRPRTQFKELLSHMSFGLSDKLALKASHDIIPEQEYLIPNVDFGYGGAPKLIHDDHGILLDPKTFSVLNMAELEVFLGKPSTLNPGLRINHDFHYQFAKAIEIGYFNNLPFLFNPNRKDQKLFVKMHNNYFRELVAKTFFNWQSCSAVFDRLLSFDKPIEAWSKITKAELKACPAYDKLNLSNLSKSLDQLFPNHQSDSSLDDIIKGTEGVGPPDLGVTGWEIHPQIDIEPGSHEPQ